MTLPKNAEYAYNEIIAKPIIANASSETKEEQLEKSRIYFESGYTIEDSTDAAKKLMEHAKTNPTNIWFVEDVFTIGFHFRIIEKKMNDEQKLIEYINEISEGLMNIE